MTSIRDAWTRAMWQPCDASGLAVFRILFGALLTISAARFLAYGWVDELFVRPQWMFPMYGFGWVKRLGANGMHLVFWAILALALCVTFGFLYRLSLALLLILFGYVQVLDSTNYLNHYYLTWLLGFLLWLMPVGRVLSIDARLWPKQRVVEISAWCTYLLRFQVGIVYLFAGVAKATPDWLLHAQPLNIWLLARTDLPLLGHLFRYREMAFAFSWAGFLFDSTVWAFLLIPRTRLVAYVIVVAFHGMTWVLFPIGMFPFIMMVSALIFFEPHWPRTLLQWLKLKTAPKQGQTSKESAHSLRIISADVQFRPRHLLAAFGLLSYVALQVLMPLRHLLYDRGSVLWDEQGMRFSWRVMAREKTGDVTYLIDYDGAGRGKEVSPSRYLTDRQLRDFATQPDMILALAHRIRDDESARGHTNVHVRAEAYASWNGRPAALLIDPQVDLARQPYTLAQADWILPEPSTSPAHLAQPPHRNAERNKP